jgi:hypothetical protein
MKHAIVALVLLMACKTGQGDDYPITPGGGGPGGTGMPHDAAITPDTGDGGPTISGRVCLLTDARDLTSCATTGAGGLLVTLGEGMATTNDDGSFTIAATSDTNASWRVADQVQGAEVVTSLVAFSADTTIPVIETQKALEIEQMSGVVPDPQLGVIVVHVAQAAAPLAGATVDATPVPQSPALYDTNDPLVWTGLATGAHGMAWLPNVQVGAAALTIKSMAGTMQTLPGIEVEANAIVFVSTTLPDM